MREMVQLRHGLGPLFPPAHLTELLLQAGGTPSISGKVYSTDMQISVGLLGLSGNKYF